jgi:hypothetical protein
VTSNHHVGVGRIVVAPDNPVPPCESSQMFVISTRNRLLLAAEFVEAAAMSPRTSLSFWN